jgi:hypothetical protein
VRPKGEIAATPVTTTRRSFNTFIKETKGQCFQKDCIKPTNFTVIENAVTDEKSYRKNATESILYQIEAKRTVPVFRYEDVAQSQQSHHSV